MGDYEPDCIFCRIARGQAPSQCVHEDGEILAFKDINPQAPVHVLVIPRRHVGTIADLADEPDLAGRLLTVAVKVARDQNIAEGGYRIVVNHGRHGTQVVGHVHLHVVGGRQLLGRLG